jgi:hypothetical protein
MKNAANEGNTKAQTINVNLSLSAAEYEWLDAFALATGRTFDEAASRALEIWLGSNGDADPICEGWSYIQRILDQAAGGNNVKKGRKRAA